MMITLLITIAGLTGIILIILVKMYRSARRREIYVRRSVMENQRLIEIIENQLLALEEMPEEEKDDGELTKN